MPRASGELSRRALRLVFGADLSMVAAVPDVDLVHSHTWYANLAGHLAGLLQDIPHVVTAHRSSRIGRGRLSNWAAATACPRGPSRPPSKPPTR